MRETLPALVSRPGTLAQRPALEAPSPRGWLSELVAMAFGWLWRPAPAPKPAPSVPGDLSVPMFVVDPPPPWHRPGEPLLGRPLTLLDQVTWAQEEAEAAGRDPVEALREVLLAPRVKSAGQPAGTPQSKQPRLETGQRPAIEGRRRRD